MANVTTIMDDVQTEEHRNRLLQIAFLTRPNKEQFYALQAEGYRPGQVVWMPFHRMEHLYLNKLTRPLMMNLTPKQLPVHIQTALRFWNE